MLHEGSTVAGGLVQFLISCSLQQGRAAACRVQLFLSLLLPVGIKQSDALWHSADEVCH